MAVDNFWHRRWRPWTITFVRPVRLSADLGCDPHAPPKGFMTGWRWKCAWGVVQLDWATTSRTFPEADLREEIYYPVWPLYAVDAARWQMAWLPVRTQSVAFRIGRDPLHVAFVDQNRHLVGTQGVETGLTYSQVLKLTGGDVTFV